MTQTPIPRLVTAMAIPTTLSTMITVIYNTADTYFVSRISPSASAAVGVVYTIMAILQAVGVGFGMGASSLISRYLGQKRDQEASVFASSGFFAAFFMGLLVGGGCQLVLEPLLRLIGASQTMMPHATPYARIILAGAPITCSGFVINNVLRAEGNTKLSMYATLAGAILNIALDPILIFTCGMGAGGAALATIVSQAVSWVIQLYDYLSGKTILKLRLANVSRSRKTYTQIITIGSPSILRQGLGGIAATALNIRAVVYGDATVAALTIAGKLYTLVRQMMVGLGQGFQPVAGYNYGAGDRKRAFDAYLFATKLGTIICTVAAAVIALLSERIMWAFCDSADVARIGTQTLLISCTVMPLLAFSTFTNQLYQCLGFAKIASFLASCRQGTFFLPCILILPIFLGELGVQMAQSVADLLTFFIAIPYALRFYRREISGICRKEQTV